MCISVCADLRPVFSASLLYCHYQNTSTDVRTGKKSDLFSKLCLFRAMSALVDSAISFTDVYEWRTDRSVIEGWDTKKEDGGHQK